MIEATVFQDSELHRLLTLLPQISESLPKNIVGLTFFVELPGGFAGAQVFVDRVCEAVWHVKRNNWRYDNTSSVHVKFKQATAPRLLLPW